jgi:hypothetical protein
VEAARVRRQVGPATHRRTAGIANKFP